MNRCFKPQGLGDILNAQLHFFSDGAELGYGASAYRRLVDVYGNVTCSFVIGKSRLAPIKQVSIPRLELSGAVTAWRLYRLLSDELEIKLDQVTLWTDSMIVLGYIKTNHDVSKPLLVTDSVSLMIQPHQTSRATLNQN